MTTKQRAIIFDDGSLAFRLYQKEYSDTYDFQVIKVSGTPDKVSDWILDSDWDSDSGTVSGKHSDPGNRFPAKIHLHFTYDDFQKNKGELRRIVDNLQMSALLRNRIFLPFEGLSDLSCRERAEAKGLKPNLQILGDNDIITGMEKPPAFPNPIGQILRLDYDDIDEKPKEHFKDKSTGPKAKRRKVSKL